MRYSFIIIKRVTNGLNIIFNIKPSIPFGPTPRCVLPKLFEYDCRRCVSLFVGTILQEKKTNEEKQRRRQGFVYLL